VAAFVPDTGDLVWLDFDPRAGHEKAGRRPAVILSPRSYNRAAGLAIACPITSHAKGYPFEVPLPAGSRVQGVILSDQVKSIDWKVRHSQRIETLDEATIADVRARIAPLLGY
jgi:mRNA interferase MazF